MINLNSLRDSRMLITGGAGMIGSTIAHLATKLGVQVTIFDAMLPAYGGNIYNLHGIEDNIRFVQGDIRNLELLKKIVKGQEYIFSLAAQVSYVDSNINPLLDLDISCRGHINTLVACQKNSPEAKLVFASSRFVYGRIDYNPVDENHPFNCLSIYGIHKLAGEKYYKFFHDAYGMRTTSLRIANPYGPRQQMKHSKYGIVNWFIRLALEEQPLTVFGDGQQARDYIFVKDVAEAMLAVCLNRKTDGQVYNLGSGTGTPFIDMVRIIAQLIPETEIKMVEWPADRYFVETGDYVSDITKLKEAVDWFPQTSLEQGIGQTIDYYRTCKEHYW